MSHRCNAWKVVTTKDLLPGDIISLSYKKRNNTKKPAPSVRTPPTATTAGAGGGAVPAVTAGADAGAVTPAAPGAPGERAL